MGRQPGPAAARASPARRSLDPTAPARPSAGEAAFPEDGWPQSLVLVHGGMAQNVGPILNMVTTKYLLRSHEEWLARQQALRIFDGCSPAVDRGRRPRPGPLTTENWNGPLKQIIPWVSNAFTEAIIAAARRALGDDFWGFLMLGGMSGGGMAFFVAPAPPR